MPTIASAAMPFLRGMSGSSCVLIRACRQFLNSRSRSTCAVSEARVSREAGQGKSASAGLTCGLAWWFDRARGMVWRCRRVARVEEKNGTSSPWFLSPATLRLLLERFGSREISTSGLPYDAPLSYIMRRGANLGFELTLPMGRCTT